MMTSRTREVLQMAMPPRRKLIVALIWGVASAGAGVALLTVSGWLIVSASLVSSLIYLNVAIVGVRFFAVSRAVFRYMERISSHDAAFRHLGASRADAVRRLIPLSPAGLGRTNTSELLSSVVDDVDELQNLSLRVVQPLVVGGVTALGAVAVVTIIWPLAGLTLLGALAIAAAAAVFVGWAAGSRADRGVSAARVALSRAVSDYVRGFETHTAFGTEPAAREAVRAADAELRRTLTRATTAAGLSSGVVSVMAGAASVFAIIVGTPAVAAGDLDPAWFAVTVLVPMAVFEVFAAVPAAASAWRSVRASAERLAAAVPDEVPAELVTTAGSAHLAAGVPALELRGASVAWPGGPDVLRDVDLDVAQGERLLVTGSSGSGKSTLAYALTRFLTVNGSYRVGGVDAADLDPEEVRTRIGLVEQRPFLFDEDIRQNLLFARDTATDDELLAVLDRVGLSEWVTERGGLDARVGERGGLVSGGQAQRLALARALLRGFDVLVLDEPTAGVDGDTSDALLADLLGATGSEGSVVLISHVAPPAGLVTRTVRLVGGSVQG